MIINNWFKELTAISRPLNLLPSLYNHQEHALWKDLTSYPSLCGWLLSYSCRRGRSVYACVLLHLRSGSYRFWGYWGLTNFLIRFRCFRRLLDVSPWRRYRPWSRCGSAKMKNASHSLKFRRLIHGKFGKIIMMTLQIHWTESITQSDYISLENLAIKNSNWFNVMTMKTVIPSVQR